MEMETERAVAGYEEHASALRKGEQESEREREREAGSDSRDEHN